MGNFREKVDPILIELENIATNWTYNNEKIKEIEKYIVEQDKTKEEDEYYYSESSFLKSRLSDLKCKEVDYKYEFIDTLERLEKQLIKDKRLLIESKLVEVYNSNIYQNVVYPDMISQHEYLKNTNITNVDFCMVGFIVSEINKYSIEISEQLLTDYIEVGGMEKAIHFLPYINEWMDRIIEYDENILKKGEVYELHRSRSDT